MAVHILALNLMRCLPCPPSPHPHGQVEEGTPFARWQASGRIRMPPDEDAAAMYAQASSTLREAGYQHYEVCVGGGGLCLHMCNLRMDAAPLDLNLPLPNPEGA